MAFHCTEINFWQRKDLNPNGGGLNCVNKTRYLANNLDCIFDVYKYTAEINLAVPFVQF